MRNTIFFFLFVSLGAQAQVSINTTGTPAVTSAMLDITSTNKGILIPRMTTIERNLIDAPATGLMIYNNTTGKYNYYSGTTWTEMLAGNLSKIVDADGDTKVDVEPSPDGDYITFHIAGNERIAILNNGIQTFFPGGSIAIGEEAGSTDDGTSNFNTTLGTSAGASLITGEHNVNLGAAAGANNSSGSENTYLGFASGNVSNSSNSVFVGAHSGEANTSGANNTFLGMNAGKLNTTASNNVFSGFEAGKNSTTGIENTFIGSLSGTTNTIGTGNVFVGFETGKVSIANNNTFLGHNAGEATTASNNTFIGQNAGNANTSAIGNTFIGQDAGRVNTTGAANTFIGEDAGFANTIGKNNVFIGDSTGLTNNTGQSNSFIGAKSGRSNTTGSSNTFLGLNAGLSNTSAGSNTFLGVSAGSANTTGAFNTFVGQLSGVNNTIGQNNTFMGQQSGQSNSLGSNNVFLGDNAGLANTTGSSNVIIGQNGASVNTTGSFNVSIGESGGSINTSGNHNTFIGFRAHPGIASLTNATALGDSAMVSTSNSIVLGNNARVGIGTSSPDVSAKTEIASTTQGFLMPRMTTAQRNDIISPAAGLLVFDTDKMTLYFFDGLSWQPMSYIPEASLQPLSRDADDGLPRNHFGQSVGISGEYSIIGAPWDSTGGINFKGAAYIFKRTNGNWIQEAKLTASDGAQGDVFGINVSISGDYAVIGASGDANSQGSAYVFLRSGTTWSQQTKITASGGLAGDQFGFAVSIFGDKAIVGAPLDDVGADVDEGTVRVFNRSGTTWTEVQTLSSATATGITHFGYAVSLITDYLVVGAPKEEMDNQGKAHVFVFGGGTWTLQASFEDPFTNDSDFGWSVSIHDIYVAIGAPNYFDAGAVFIKKRTGSTWADYGASHSGLTDAGSSVAITNDYVLSGDPGADRTYVYRNTGTGYSYLREIEDPNDDSASLGFSADIDQFNVITGAPGVFCSLCFTGYLGNVLFLNLE